MAGRELFVWYRVARERAGAARVAVAAMQLSLRAEWPGLQARLLVRDDGETSTWMETYSRPPRGHIDGPGVASEIEAAIATAARPLETVIDGARHVEAFTEVA